MQRTDLNVSPFFDDFNEDKNFHRILFRPRAVQARELNQMQSILSSQIERMGRNIFEEGAMVIPGGIKSIDYQNSVTLEFVGGSQFTDLSSQITDVYIKSNVSDITAKISKLINASGADTYTAFIDYMNSGSSQEKTFTDGEACTAFIYNSDGSTNSIASVNVVSNYVGQWVKVQSGVYFIRGMFVKTDDQEVILSKYSTDSSVRVGFKVNESIVNEVEDSSLLSNAIGYPNFNSPGASRLKITLTLSTLALNSTDQDFIEIARLENGVLQNKVDYTDYSLIQNAIAQRTYETNGNFTVSPFGIDIKEHLNDGTNNGVYLPVNGGLESKFVAAIKPGIGYVLGYRVENIGLRNISIDKARDTTTLNNSVTSIDYGQYVIVQNMSSIPDMDIKKKFSLKNSSNTLIGTASIRAVNYEGSNKYRLYLFNIVWEPNKSINDLAKITYSDVSNNFSCDISGTPVLYGSGNNTLIYPLPVGAVKSLYINGNPDTSYTVTRSYNATTNGSGVATISCSGGESFGPVNSSDYIVADTGGTNGGAIYDPSSIVLSGSPIGSSITVSLGVPNANKNIKVICPIFKQTSVQKTKTLTTVTDESIVFTNVSKMNLSKADIHSIVSVIDSDTDEDITSMFILDNGQRSNFYSIGSISTVNLSNITRNTKVTYKYFQHSTGDYFTADSYGGLDRTEIPVFALNGINYNLADCTDFRPLQDATGSFTVLTFNGDMVKPSSMFLADILYYLPRIDIIYVDANGNFGSVRGVPSIKPTVPATPSNAMKLYELSIPSYTAYASDVNIRFIENKRYTMRDIGKLEDRISNVEYYTTLSSLENSVNSINVIDPVTGNNRFKNGFAVDGFTDFVMGDTTSSDWKASLDLEEGTLKPQFTENGLDYSVANATSTSMNSPKETWMKPYTTTPLINQPYATRTININPYAVFTWVGEVKLSPSSDFWKDVKYAAPVVINNTINLRGNSVQGTVWNSWETSDRLITSRTTTTFSSTFTTKSFEDSLSTSIIPYQRSIPVKVTLSGFKPFTRLYPFWDGVMVQEYCTPNGGILGDNIVTDVNGSVSVTYTIPNTDTAKFKTGTSVMRWTDSSTDSRVEGEYTTKGETTFVSSGSLENRQLTTVNTTTLLASASTSITSVRASSGGDRGRDPIAQTFTVPTSGGAFIPKIDIYFSTKSKSIPVTLQIRTVSTGLPTDIVIASVTLNPSSVNTSTDGTVATSFVFDDPIYLMDTQEYAIVLLSDTQEYNVYIAELGQVVIGSQMALSKQANIGVFLTSSNGSTWNPNQIQDLKFVIHRCVFSTSVSSELILNNDIPVILPFDFNPIKTTNGSNVITFNMKSHGLLAGDTISISGATGGNGFDATVINTTLTVSGNTIDTFDVTMGSNANVTGYIGGSNITARVNYPFVRFVHTADTFIPNNTTVVWEYQYKTQSGRTSSSWNRFDIRNDIDLVSEGIVRSVGDFKVRATLTTNVDNLSPCIGVGGQGTILISPRVNNDIANPVYSYVTYPIKFNNPSTSAKFYIGSFLPNGSNMKVYYKPIDNLDQDLGSVSWTELSSDKPIVNDMSSFIEYTYTISNIGSFVGYVVKVVLLTNDPVNYPVLSDFRSIALA